MDTANFKVLIAGGSIAGLVLANILEQLGIDFVVLEAWPEIAPQVGASIGFLPNGCRILDQIGCYDDLHAKLDESITAMQLKSPKAENLGTPIDEVGKHFIQRHGYDVIFVDRQMAIEVFYDHIKDKSKVLVDQRVLSVKPIENGVQVTTNTGATYTGDILVGADGVHSIVRKEMWRLGDELAPGYFPLSDRTDVPCDYLCMFGISILVPGLKKKYAIFTILGQDHSYLVIDGPSRRVYWFLFVKCDKTLRGMDKEIPRTYSKEEEKAMAEQYWHEPMEGDITFGDLYKSSISTTLTTLPEFVCSKWHFGRITTIGDAVHKQNPITGQGGNSAIETAATLATELFQVLKRAPDKSKPSDADITHAFETTQKLRQDRVAMLIEAAHYEQRISALETPFHKFLATQIIPLAGGEATMENFANAILGARPLPLLPVPKRPRFEPFHNERPAPPLYDSVLASFFPLAIAAAVFATLLVSAARASPLLETRLPTAQTLALLLPIHLIWTTEAHRLAHGSTLLALPLLATLPAHFLPTALALPLYFLIALWPTTRPPSSRAVGRTVAPATARALLPAVLLGYGVPTAVMLARPGAASTAAWRLSGVFVSLAVRVGSCGLERWRPSGGAFGMYAKKDVGALRAAYAVVFAVCSGVHAARVSSLVPLPSSVAEGDVAGVVGALWEVAASALGDSGNLAVALWCLWSVWELRRNGWVATGEALGAAVAVGIAQVLVGPAAGYAGLWWWREGVRAREARLG